jgi:hypothetical protein
VDQLVQERLEDVAGADPGICGNGKAELAGYGEAEPVWPPACSPHLEFGLAAGQGPIGERR